MHGAGAHGVNPDTKFVPDMRDLYDGTTEPPTLDEVLDRVHASRALLDFEIAS